jgi:membrane protease YdiL (CAAX protease family)
VEQGKLGVWPRVSALLQIVAVIAALFIAAILLAWPAFLLLPEPVRMPAMTAATLFAVAIGGLFLRRDGLSYRELGLRKPARGLVTIGWAAAGFVVAEVGASVLGVVFAAAFKWSPPDVDSVRDSIINDPVAYVAWIAAAWICAAFGEELTARGFFMNRLGRVFGADRRGMVWAAVGQALIFGLLHAPQGPAGVLVTTYAGLVFAWIYYASGRNFWAPILAHGVMDTFALTLLFLGYWPPGLPG